MANDISPAFQWYPKDALSSIRLSMLTLEEEGAYRRALDYCWLHGSIPADPNKLIRLIGKGCTIEIAEAIIPMFEVLDGKLYHERLEQERSKQKAFREKQSDNGKRGGRPKLNPTESQEKGLGSFGETQTEAKESSSVSNLQSSNSIKEKETKVSKKNNLVMPDDIEPDVWARYLKLNEWLKTNAPNILKIQEQITVYQYQKLTAKMHGTELAALLIKMHNWKGIDKKNVSVYLTALDWAKRENNTVSQKAKKESETITHFGIAANRLG
jgi:uncharacterized protein YdaU (DUF1376 family)